MDILENSRLFGVGHGAVSNRRLLFRYKAAHYPPNKSRDACAENEKNETNAYEAGKTECDVYRVRPRHNPRC